MSIAYYNEHDASAAAWLRELIKAGLIAPGEVDERDIQDVLPRELVGYTQCHFFAGIGVWSYSLHRAGWSDSRRVWTGSCPCQPFSAAGERRGFADERHLWPAWYHLIKVNRPDVVFGEQVADKGGFAWFDLVQADLEAEAYRIGALDLPACGFGAPHKRQRLFFVADSTGQRYEWWRTDQARQWASGEPEGLREAGGMADTEGFQRRLSTGRARSNDFKSQRSGEARNRSEQPGATNGFWRDAEWIACRDGKLRPTQSGVFPLVDGVAARMAKLRGIGNAIVAPVAEEFIRAYLEVRRTYDAKT